MAKETKRSPSRHELDLEERLKVENESQARVDGTVNLNPNPFGEEAYAGTDPIYQNHANMTEAPIAAEGGAYKAAEEEVKERYDLDGVAEEKLADDYGLGGKASVAGSKVVVPSDVTVGDSSSVHHRDEEAAEDSKVSSTRRPPAPPNK